jgi:phenylalanyl-tRNA synthetase beta subunit
VEHIALDTEYGTGYTEYVNMGDPYSHTLCLLPDERFLISSWGDIVEQHEREYGYENRGW